MLLPVRFQPLDKACVAATRAPWATFAPTWRLEYRGALDEAQLSLALSRVVARYPWCAARMKDLHWVEGAPPVVQWLDLRGAPDAAGRGIGKKVLELTDDDFDQMMAINVKSALYGIQAVVPHFQERKEGQLINVSSFLGRVPLASYRSAYNAAKAALNALTANLRMDLAGAYPGIQIGLVMPGPVSTDFSNNALGGTPMVPPPRLTAVQTADDVADVIAGMIENPRAEVYTSPTLRALTKRYYEDVAGFEAGMSAPALAAPNLQALADRLKKRE